MKNKIHPLFEKVFLNIFLCTAILMAGCASQKEWAYRPNTYNNEAKKGNESVAVLPFTDSRSTTNRNNSALYWIPLVPFGTQHYEMPELKNQHANSEAWLNYRPKDDFAKALVQDLLSSNMFKEAYYSENKKDADLLIQGKIISTKYTSKIFSYGVTPFACMWIWFLGAPATRTTNELTIELSVVNVKRDAVIFSKSYTAPKYKKTSWIYSLQSDFQYSEMLTGIYKQFIQDYRNAPISKEIETPKNETKKSGNAQQPAPTTKTKGERLKELKQFYDDKTITKEEYDKEKSKILNEK